MSFINRVVVLLLAVSLFPGTLSAQVVIPRGKNFSSFKKFRYKKIAASVQRKVRYTRKPDMRLSVARLDHALLLKTPRNVRPHSTAFLFQTTYKGQPEIWAATSGHVAQAQEPVRLTFYKGDQEIVLNGVVAQQGPALLSDAALIKITSPIPGVLRPLTLTEHPRFDKPLDAWGYASNQFYRLPRLTFEKDNTRFIRTNFPDKQTKRAGLCGGPLLDAKGQAAGIICGSSLTNKTYFANTKILPYLLQAYHEGTADIPLVIHGKTFGKIRIDERVWMVQNMDGLGRILSTYEVEEQLHQSKMSELLEMPGTRLVKFVLGHYENGSPVFRTLVYELQTGSYYFEPFE